MEKPEWSFYKILRLCNSFAQNLPKAAQVTSSSIQGPTVVYLALHDLLLIHHFLIWFHFLTVFLLSIPGSWLLPVSPQHLQHALTSRPLLMLFPCPAFFWSLFQYDLTKKEFLNTLFKRTLHHTSFPSRFSVVLTCLLSLVSLDTQHLHVYLCTFYLLLL